MTFTCLTWNLLAQRYSKGLNVKPWNERLQIILHFLLSKDFDIICLQEVDLVSFDNDFQCIFDKYNVIVHKIDKNRSNVIGNAILCKKSKFDIIDTKLASYAIFTKLREIEQDTQIIEQNSNRDMLLINVHLKAGLKSGLSTRISQLNSCLKRSKSFNTSNVIICGDFNDNFSDETLKKILIDNGFTLSFDNNKKTCVFRDGSFWNFDHVASSKVNCVYLEESNVSSKIPSDDILSDHFPIIFQIE